jgi:hypothetical protein
MGIAIARVPAVAFIYEQLQMNSSVREFFRLLRTVIGTDDSLGIFVVAQHDGSLGHFPQLHFYHSPAPALLLAKANFLLENVVTTRHEFSLDQLG